jgi:DNA-binding MarR family transcriptional regulator
MSTQYLEEARAVYATVRLLHEKIVRLESHRSDGVDGDLCAVDLTFPQWNTVKVVHDHGHVTIKGLSEALQVSAPSASAMVERLVEMGMLMREQSQTDRREVIVRVTDSGRRALDEMESTILSTLSTLMSKLTRKEVEQWCRVYQRLSEILQAETQDHADEPASGLA